MSSEISRKQFLTSLAVVSVAAIVGVNGSSKEKKTFLANSENTGNWKITPLPGSDNTESFLKFCETARFNSVEHALRSIRNPEQEFVVSKCIIG